MKELAKREINDVHVEAGARLNGALAMEGLIDEYLIYVAPVFLGDGRVCWIYLLLKTFVRVSR